MHGSGCPRRRHQDTICQPVLGHLRLTQQRWVVPPIKWEGAADSSLQQPGWGLPQPDNADLEVTWSQLAELPIAASQVTGCLLLARSTQAILRNIEEDPETQKCAAQQECAQSNTMDVRPKYGAVMREGGRS